MLLHQIISALSGKDSEPPSMDVVASCYLQKQKMIVDDFLWENSFQHGLEVEQIVNAFEDMTNSQKSIAFLCPAVRYNIRASYIPIMERLESMKELFLAESSIKDADLRCESMIEAESFFDKSSTQWGLLGRFAWAEVSGERVKFVAEQTADNITFDFFSPQVTSRVNTSGVRNAKPKLPRRQDMEIVINKFTKALESLDSFSGTYGRLVRNSVRAIRCRFIEGDRSGSESEAAEAGAIRFLNAHLDSFDTESIRDSILHESVHNFLYMYEEVDGEFAQHEAPFKFRPLSPWTNNPIPAKSFVHAAFVWYALFNLTLLDIEKKHHSFSEIKKLQSRRNYYSSGFLGSLRLSSYLDKQGVFKPGVLHALDLMQEDVKHKMN